MMGMFVIHIITATGCFSEGTPNKKDQENKTELPEEGKVEFEDL